MKEEIYKLDKKDKRIIKILTENPNGLRAKALSKLIEVPRKTCYNHLSKLKKREILIKENFLWKIDYVKIKKVKKDIKTERHFNIENKECYFCNYDLIIQLHHIIPKKDGGSDEDWNLLPLCPNHHMLIHHGGFKLEALDGIFILRNKKIKDQVILPIEAEILKNKTRNHPLLINNIKMKD